MATMTITQGTPATLSLRFTRFEKVLGLVRDQDIPLSAVTSARVEPSGLAAVRGLRAPGLGMPGLRMVGTWRGRGRTLVSVRRGEPALMVELTGLRYERLVIGSPDAAALVEQLEVRA
jgi:hypothetical protein